MVKCVFCGKEEHPTRGLHLIKNDGNVEFFCSSKCRKNSLKLGRDKKKFKWTAAFHEQKQRLADKMHAQSNTQAQTEKEESKPKKSKKQ